ncbi:UNVERIFIED_CONTAM: hypothetical protein HDU68_005370, partial [Siphonaria sp. JEL0065]
MDLATAHQLVLASIEKGPFEAVKNLVLALTVLKYAKYVLAYIRVKGLRGAIQGFIKYVLQRTVTLMRAFVPGADKLVAAEVTKNVTSLQKKIVGDIPENLKQRSLPQKGLPSNAVISELKRLKGMDKIDWKAGKVSGAIYHGGDEVNKLITEAFGMYTVSNPLHPELFPGIRQMEAEVVSMVLNMYNAPADACGSMTSGGTESLLM